MFLIEGDGQAILYTGDIRCESRKSSGQEQGLMLCF